MDFIERQRNAVRRAHLDQKRSDALAAVCLLSIVAVAVIEAVS